MLLIELQEVNFNLILLFDSSLLPQASDEERGIEVINFEDGGGRRYYRNRNYLSANIDYMNTSLDLRASEFGKRVVIPDGVEQQTRAVLRAEGQRYGFGGYTEYEHLYWRRGFDDRLQQKVNAVHLPQGVSSVIETLSINRYALDWAGDLTYGLAILQTSEVTDRLGMKLSDGDPVFLAFTPDKVLGKTYGPGPEVIGETTYEKLADAGIKARFINEVDKATLNLAAGNVSFKLRLGKVLKPNYPELLFSDSEEWITVSGIFVGRVPVEALN